MDSALPRSAHETISARLRLILRGLSAALGLWRLDAVQAVALYRRIGGIAGRIERMMVRFRAGRLWRVTERVATRRLRARRLPALLPRRFGWLVQAGAHEAASFGAQLQAVVNEPDMVALLAASPQAMRVLRPLCRALAVEMPGCPARPRRADSVSVRRFRTRAKPEPFRVPLPRGVLTAARLEGFGRDR